MFPPPAAQCAYLLCSWRPLLFLPAARLFVLLDGDCPARTRAGSYFTAIRQTTTAHLPDATNPHNAEGALAREVPALRSWSSSALVASSLAERASASLDTGEVGP